MIERDTLLSIEIGSPLLHEMSDAMDVGAVAIDQQFIIRAWNHWLEIASGLTAADVVGRSLLEVYPELVGSQSEAAFRRALHGGAVFLSNALHRYLLPLRSTLNLEYGNGHALETYDGGELMQQNARIVPVVRRDLTVDGAVAFIHDVTERVMRERELRAAIERAESANEAKSKFLASMSHELRTPLGAIVGYADLLSLQLSGPIVPAQQEQLDRIKRSSRHLLHLVEEILTFARTEAGKETFEPVDTDVRDVVRDAVMMLEPQAAEKGLTIDTSLPPVPSIAFTDPTKLRQILVNLLGNAIKFTPTGRVSVAIVMQTDRLVFSVSDTGPGIPREERERIFEAFTQLGASRTRVTGGTGLGLSVSRNLAHLLGGDLEVESTVGVGSTFAVWIPRRGEADDVQRRDPVARAVPRGTEQGASPG